MTRLMKAVGFSDHLPISDPSSLVDFTLPRPTPRGHDLLVEVNAVSVNPVDIGVRKGGRTHLSKPKIIGWDAYGTVVDTGSQVSLFKGGDKVYYAGSIKRPGSDSEFQLVDERIVGLAPKTLSPAQIAAMPLTGLTAFEALFEQLEIPFADIESNKTKSILIISGAGGVGSIATQLAKLAGLQVISTASREESRDWCITMGADVVVNHHLDLVKQVRDSLGKKYVDYILELNDLDGHWDEMCQLIAPSGKIASITENQHSIDLKKLTKKRGKFAWEWMYTKSYFETADMVSQHNILNTLADLLDTGKIKSTVSKTLTPINAKNLREAHRLVETNHMLGKVVVSKR